MLLDDCCVVIVIVSVWSCYFGHFLFLIGHFRSALRKYAQGNNNNATLLSFWLLEKSCIRLGCQQC